MFVDSHCHLSFPELASRLPEIRHEKVQEIRRQIAAGTYETPEKLDSALDRLLDELHGRW